jgi:hypothetical protein
MDYDEGKKRMLAKRVCGVLSSILNAVVCLVVSLVAQLLSDEIQGNRFVKSANDSSFTVPPTPD